MQFFVVMSPTIGAVRYGLVFWFFCTLELNVVLRITQTNFLSVHRILGTL